MITGKIGLEEQKYILKKSVSEGIPLSVLLKSLNLTFAYDGKYKLIAVGLSLVNASYDDIKEKLIRIHGNGEVKIDENEGIDLILWRGDNNSAILLYTLSDGMDYTLMYGRLDAEDIIMNCLEIDPDETSGL